MKRWVFCALMAACAMAVATELGPMFSDNMVLQRDVKAPVWGFGEPGETVTVEFAGQKKTAVADSAGRWEVILDPMAASAESRSLKVTGKTALKCDSVAVGDVWFCVGQSNMEWQFRHTVGGAERAKSANDPLIRLLRVPYAWSPKPQTKFAEEAVWEVSSPKSAGQFSGVGYWFGEKLRPEIGVPLGLVNMTKSGSRIEAWSTPDAYRRFPALKADLQTMEKTVADALVKEPERRDKYRLPTMMYQAMLTPAAPFAARGILYYQGEDNRREAETFADKMGAFILGWRNLFRQPELPIYLVMLPKYNYPELAETDMAEFRRAQQTFAERDAHAGYIVAIDMGEDKEVHPRDKKAVGHRLADLVLFREYGKGDEAVISPTFRSATRSGGTVTVEFNRPNGLQTCDGKAPSCFELAGADGVFVPAEAKIDGDRVILTSAGTVLPLTVRFGWKKLDSSNLVNRRGVMVTPFLESLPLSFGELSSGMTLESSAAKPSAAVSAELAVPADWGYVELTGSVAVTRMVPAQAAPFGAFIDAAFLGKDGAKLGSHQLYMLSGRTEVPEAFRVPFNLPVGTEKLVLTLGIRSADAAASFGKLQLRPLSAPGVAADATPSAGRTVTWGQEPMERTGSLRAETVLNGLWQFQPVVPERNLDRPLGVGWGLINVPGSWRDWKESLPGIDAVGGGELWNVPGRLTPVKRFARLAAGWYRRELTVPADWSGRKIQLEFTRIAAVARIWIDGRYCGRVTHPEGVCDITKFVTPGRKAELLIQVVATENSDAVPDSAAPVSAELCGKFDPLRSAGLTGDVILLSRPAGPELAGVFIRTSVRRKELALQLELEQLAASGEITVETVVRTPGGDEVKRFPVRTVNVKPDDAGNAVADVAYEWRDPKLWDFDEPNLYRLDVSVRGCGVDETRQERFGFREFRISGRDFLLNERKINLRPTGQNDFAFPIYTVEMFKHTLASWKRTGFNTHEIWPEVDSPGRVYYPETPCLDYCAEVGWPVIANLEGMRRFVLKFEEGSPGRKEWCEKVTAKVRKFRNNPAIIMWVHSGNTYTSVSDQDPRYLGNRNGLLKSGALIGREFSGKFTTDFLHRLDPTRPVMVHAGCVGDVYTLNSYPSLLPLQEQEEWLSEHVKTGDVPLMAVEFGLIPAFDFRRGRFGYQYVRNTETQMAERLATRYGRAAYQQESMRAACWNRDTFVKEQLYRGGDRFIPDPLAQKFFAEDVLRIYRSWRTAGVTGGMIYWMINDLFDRGRLHAENRSRAAEKIKQPPFRPGMRGVWLPYLGRGDFYGLDPAGAVAMPGGEALMDSYGPTLSFIAGGAVATDPMAFVDKSHSYYGGEALDKQLVVFNDTRKDGEYRVECDLLIGGKVVATFRDQGSVAAAERKFVPVRFELPAVTAKTGAELQLRAEVAGRKHFDRFELRIFPARPAPAAKTLTVYDPGKSSLEHFRKLGYQARELTGEPEAGSLLVIGRNAFDAEPDLLNRFEPFVKNGGRLLVMSQKQVSRDFRKAQYVSRQVFAVDRSSPVSAGLDDEDLRDWRGSGTMIEAYPAPVKAQNLTYGWHWGNRGSVASVVFEKPHYGSATALFECEFDLAYSPLWEQPYGQGGLIFCQFDFEGRSVADPAAERLFDNIVGYAVAKKFAPRSAATVYLGNDTWRQKLGRAGAVFSVAEQLDPAADLAIVAPGAKVTAAELRDFVRTGKRALVMGSASALFGVKTKKVKDFRGSLNVPSWPVAAGLSTSDLRWRSPKDTEVFADGKGYETGADGLFARIREGEGEIIFSLLNPDQFETEKYPYFRFTRWRQSRALSQLLTNLGTVFESDPAIFKARSKELPTYINLASAWRGKLVTPCGVQTRPMEHFPMTEAAKAAVKPEFDDSTWQVRNMPFMWQTDARDDSNWGDDNGEAIFRKEIMIPEELAGKDLVVSLGAIDDFDMVFLNGERIGFSFNYKDLRVYTAPGKLVRKGRNLLAVRVFDRWGSGGMAGPAGKMRIQLRPDPEPEKLYHTDYLDDNFTLGDDPYRYFRW